MTTETTAGPKWLSRPCFRCGGHGLYAVWWGDYDIEDCRECSNGRVWISRKDRVAAYPGGPFLGSAPGEYERLRGKDR